MSIKRRSRGVFGQTRKFFSKLFPSTLDRDFVVSVSSKEAHPANDARICLSLPNQLFARMTSNLELLDIQGLIRPSANRIARATTRQRIRLVYCPYRTAVIRMPAPAVLNSVIRSAHPRLPGYPIDLRRSTLRSATSLQRCAKIAASAIRVILFQVLSTRDEIL